MAEAAVGAQSVPTQQTSIDDYEPSEVTVRFRRWTALDGTAYMRNQQAGFRRSQVADLERRGIVDIVHIREPIANRMVRKGA